MLQMVYQWLVQLQRATAVGVVVENKHDREGCTAGEMACLSALVKLSGDKPGLCVIVRADTGRGL